MKNIELQQLLMKLPPNMEVGTFKVGSAHIHDITQIYIGNERYIPNGKKTDNDKIVIEYK